MKRALDLFPSTVGSGLKGRGTNAHSPHPDPFPAEERAGDPTRYACRRTSNQRSTWNRHAQLVVVLLCAFALKLYYSTASANQLRWILAPTTVFVEFVSGTSFGFESYAGYMSSDRSFLIATSCAGVNFLITAFLMLSVRKLLRERSQNLAWRFIPTAALIAYLATLVANTVRISIALRLQPLSAEIGWLSPNQLHRFEGIFIYFGFLLLLYVISEKISSEGTSGLFRQSFFPLLMYYATMLGIPLANSAYRQGTDFWEYSLFVLLTPLLLILPLAAFRFYRQIAISPGRHGSTESRSTGYFKGSRSGKRR